MLEIDGVVPIVPVPFSSDGRIDEESLRRLVEFCVEERASALCLPAYGSEFYKLSEQERVEVTRIAAGQAAGRLPVLGQANHASLRVATDLARRMEEAGAAMISIATPRVFALSEGDLLRYFSAFCREIRSPVLIQDFNPGGPTVGPDFARRLHAECPNFRYLKLEDPLMGPRVRAILEATAGQVGVLEGWGGMYMMELIPCGICGVMPGVPLLRVLREVYRKQKSGLSEEAYAAFQSVLPFIVFTLQNMEVFLNVEKRLLRAMRLIETAHVREATVQLDADTLEYADWLIAQMLPLVMPRADARSR
jgi:dihydrodipicolinate synthase/N-acetylneuraminate lyase